MEFSRQEAKVTIPFSRGSSSPRDQTCVSCMASRFFTIWGTTKGGWPTTVWDLSSEIRDQIHIPCIGRWILNHWTTRKVPNSYSFISPFSYSLGNMGLFCVCERICFLNFYFWSKYSWLQCRVNHCCAAKWFSCTHTHTHTHTFLSVMAYCRILNLVLCVA